MKFIGYHKYKNSHVPWLGNIPDSWDLTRLKNIFQLMKRPPLHGDGIVTAFRDGQVTLRSNRRTDGYTNAINEHGYQRILKNDLVIHAMDAFAGAIGISDSEGKSTPVYSVCTPKKESILPEYYGRLLRHMALSGYINALAKGVRERSTEFRWKESSNIFVPVPSREEQSAIANFLDAETAIIDALVTEQWRLIELLKEKRQAVISHAVTKGLNPNAPLKDSGIEWLGEVPEHWSVVPVKRLVEVKDGTHATPAYVDPSENTFPLITSKDFGEESICFDHAKHISAVDHEEVVRRSNTEQGDVLMSMIGGNIGKALIVQTERPFSIKNVALFKTKNNPAIAKYVLYYLQSGLLDVQIDLLSRGGAQGFLGLGDIRNLVFFKIPSGELEEIVEELGILVAGFTQLLSEAKRAIGLLQERRNALISAAVTGKIDVREYATKETT